MKGLYIFVAAMFVTVGVPGTYFVADRMQKMEYAQQVHEMPVMSGSTNIRVETGEYRSVMGRRTTYTVDASPEEVLRFYKEAMPPCDWWYLDVHSPSANPNGDPSVNAYRQYIAESLSLPTEKLPQIFVMSHREVAVLWVVPQGDGSKVELFVYRYELYVCTATT